MIDPAEALRTLDPKRAQFENGRTAPAPAGKIPWHVRGWLWLAGALLLLALAAWTDRWTKRAPHPGFLPADAAVTAFAPDLAALLDAARASGAGRALMEEWGGLPAEFALRVRRATGVRPTPLRVRAWLGRGVLVAKSGGAWGVCVKPGLLMRAAHTFNRVSGGCGGNLCALAGVDGEPPLHYAWRDGYVIASHAPAFIQAALDAPPAEIGTAWHTPHDAVWLAWSAAPAGNLVLRAVEGVPVQGRIDVPIAVGSRQFDWPYSPDTPPIAAITARRWSDIDALFEAAAALLDTGAWPEPIAQLAALAARPWGFHRLDADWDGALRQCALLLTGIDFDETLPIPEAAMMLHAEPVEGPREHPLAPLAAHERPIPYLWGEDAGEITPILGEKLSLCLTRRGNVWLAASQEPVMDRLLSPLVFSPCSDADAAARIEWAAAGTAAGRIAARLAELELLPERNARDVDREFTPVVRFLQRLGRLEIVGRAEDGALAVGGFLAVESK